MLNFCPLVTIKADGAIKAKLQPINPEFQQYGRGHIESVETFAECCARLGAVNEYPSCADEIVVSVREITNTYCGGKVRYQLLIAKRVMSRFECYQTFTAYLSEQSDGTLRIAFPA